MSATYGAGMVPPGHHLCEQVWGPRHEHPCSTGAATRWSSLGRVSTQGSSSRREGHRHPGLLSGGSGLPTPGQSSIFWGNNIKTPEFLREPNRSTDVHPEPLRSAMSLKVTDFREMNVKSTRGDTQHSTASSLLAPAQAGNLVYFKNNKHKEEVSPRAGGLCPGTFDFAGLF